MFFHVDPYNEVLRTILNDSNYCMCGNVQYERQEVNLKINLYRLRVWLAKKVIPISKIVPKE